MDATRHTVVEWPTTSIVASGTLIGMLIGQCKTLRPSMTYRRHADYPISSRREENGRKYSFPRDVMRGRAALAMAILKFLSAHIVQFAAQLKQ